MPGLRLSKRALVRKGWEYSRIYAEGKRLHCPGFTLICLPNGTNQNRLGISIHRKIRGAVRRNRLKRIIRESFRTGRNHYPQGVDMIMAVRTDFSCSHPEEIKMLVSPLGQKYRNHQTDEAE